MASTADDSEHAAPVAATPLTHAQPDVLWTLARLRGLRPAAIATARVLEWGCGAGENLLPLAERYPAATFVGIDASEQSLEAAQQSARALGLHNIRFHPVAQDDFAVEPFDYLVAGNSYGRSAPAARDRLLARCGALLAPHGIACIGIQTRPGRHEHAMLRSLVQYASRQAQPAEQLTAARAFLDFLHDSLTATHPYHALLQAALTDARSRGDAALQQEYLDGVSQPVFFHEFADRVRAGGLEVVGDAGPAAGGAQRLDPRTEAELAALTGDAAEQELLRDVVANRSTRAALLCHQAAVPPAPLNELTADLYFESTARPETPPADVASPAPERFSNAGGVGATVEQPLLKAALTVLAEMWPMYLSRDELRAAAGGRLEGAGGGAPGTDDFARLDAELLACCRAGLVQPHGHAASFVAWPSDAPRAGGWARAQARFGTTVTNRRHESVQLDPSDCQLLQWLDGTRGNAALAALLASGGRLEPEDENAPQWALKIGPSPSAEPGANPIVDPRAALAAALARLARAALLIG